MEKQKRLAALDLIKFLAMFFVVLYHGRYMWINIMKDLNLKTFCLFFIHTLLSTCVPMFFFVNGFLLINKELNLKKHILKTFKFIAITFIWGAITLYILSILRENPFSAKEFIESLWSFKQDWINHLWFMGALVGIYFVFPIIKAAFDSNRKAFNYFVLFCTIVVFSVSFLDLAATFLDMQFEGGKRIIFNNWLNMFNPLRGVRAFTLAYFLIGCYFGANRKKIDEKIKKFKFINPVTLILIIAVSTALYAYWGIWSSHVTGEQWDTVWFGYDEIFILIDTVSFYLLSRYYKGNAKNPFSYIVKAVSKNTLGIYFTHIIILELARYLKITQLGFMQNYISFIIYAFIILLICAGISALLKKIPILKKLV